MQEGGWLPALIVPAATSPTTMPVGSHAAGDSHSARPHRSPAQGGTHAGCPQHPSSPAVQAGLPANISPTRTPTPSNPDNVYARSHESPTPRSPDPTRTPTPSEAQPKHSPAQKLPQPLPQHRRGSSAGRCRCSP